MTGLFGGAPKPSAPIIPAPAPMKSDAEVVADAAAERARLAAAKGRGATLLTGADTAPAPSAPKVLLGSN
ncbi:hypothetical protein UFOVP843_15 [uncultured Caudovirales phage]|uniref:Uncharacterized protein n=1 Tax=uncultured Caudovirales phage TaxID=2100421 RepID=A0A6J5PEY0_9CAUD|nr:hypothetical protein UFOVP843_15 [uncultured Caudovirales phage]CAB4172502.1 hypothetical protein UFOVP936_32 [uncultured Caudovirales phage]